MSHATLSLHPRDEGATIGRQTERDGHDGDHRLQQGGARGHPGSSSRHHSQGIYILIQFDDPIVTFDPFPAASLMQYLPIQLFQPPPLFLI